MLAVLLLKKVIFQAQYNYGDNVKSMKISFFF